MTDDEDDDLTEDEEAHFRDICDVSDVTVSLIPRKTRKQVFLEFKSERDFTLMRYYLALCQHKHEIEIEMGVMEESEIQ